MSPTTSSERNPLVPAITAVWAAAPGVVAGRVAFGSSKDKWGFNFAMLKAAGMSFKDIIEAYNSALGRCMRRIVEWTLRTGAKIKPAQ